MSVQPVSGSTGATGTTDGLPVLNSAFEPESVRDGSPETKKAYESALAFEQTFVEQLAHSLTALGGGNGEREGEGEGGAEGSGGAGDSELSSLLPQALTTSVMQAGGLGMAAQLAGELQGVHGTAHTHADGGTGAA
jgi:hypothetical protein